MIIPTASDKKSVRVRLLVDDPEEGQALLEAAKAIFKRVTLMDEDSDKNNIQAQVSYMDGREILILLPKYACLRIKDAELIKKTEWGVNRVKIKVKEKGEDSITYNFWFKKSV